MLKPRFSVFRMVSVLLTLCVLAFAQSSFANAGVAAYGNTAMWDHSNEANRAAIDHSAWDGLLAKFVVEVPESPIRQFRYKDMDKSDLRQLNAYIKRMEKTDPRSYSRQEQLAYWMNLFNAVSVREIQPLAADKDGLSAVPDRLWATRNIKVARQKLSLDDIEHGILRPIWKDHRIHFGLNCGTMDCPNMDRRAYTAATVRNQLRAAGTRFVNDDRGVHYAEGKLTVSRMFDTYRDDFAADPRTLMKVFAHYAQDMKALYLLGYQGEIFYSQDLRLNSP